MARHKGQGDDVFWIYLLPLFSSVAHSGTYPSGILNPPAVRFVSFGVFVVPKNSPAVLRSLTEHGNVPVRSSEQDCATRGESPAVLFWCLRSKIHPVNKKPSADTEGFLF